MLQYIINALLRTNTVNMKNSLMGKINITIEWIDFFTRNSRHTSLLRPRLSTLLAASVETRKVLNLVRISDFQRFTLYTLVVLGQENTKRNFMHTSNLHATAWCLPKGNVNSKAN